MVDEAEVVKLAREPKETIVEKLREAEAEHGRCEAKVRALEDQLGSVQGTLRQIEDAPEVTQADLLERENARRKVRTLKAAIATARAAAEKAEAAAGEAQLAADKVELLESRSAVQRDVIALGDYLLDLERQILARLAAHRKLVADRRALENSVRTASGGAPVSMAAGGTVFSLIPDDPADVWDGVAHAITQVRESGRARARQLLHAEGIAKSADALAEHQRASEAAYERSTHVAPQRAEKGGK